MPQLCMALSFGGIVGAHSLAYLLVHPDPHARHQMLHDTGHSWWGQLGLVAAAIAVAALIAFVSQRLRSRTGDPSLARIAPLLVLLQVGGFILLEGAERSVAGSGALSILSEGVVHLGVAVQVVVALCLAVALVLLSRVVDRITSRRDGIPDPGEGSGSWWPFERSVLPRIFDGKAFDVRGPPVPLRV